MTRTVKVLCIQTVTVCNSNIIQVTPTTPRVTEGKPDVTC